MTKRPMQVDDLYHIITTEDPRISPDGQWVVYVRVTLDKDENSYKRNLWISPIRGGKARQLTRSGKDSQPRWSPDGTQLAFVSGRDGKPQIYLLPMTVGGEARPLTSMMNGATAPAWSPNGDYIAFLSATNEEERKNEGIEQPPPTDKHDGKARKERQEEQDRKKFDPLVVTKIPYRVGTSYLSDRHEQIYIIRTTEGLTGDDAKPRRLTNLAGNHEPPQWSHDGKFIYTAHQTDITLDEPFRNSAIYRINVRTGEETRLTDDTHTAFAPKPSPNGEWLAFTRFPIEGRKSLFQSIDRIAIMSIDGGDVLDVNLELDRSSASVNWASDGNTLIFSLNSEGNTPIYKANIATGTVELLSAGIFKIAGADVSPSGDVVFCASTDVCPIELMILPVGEFSPIPITTFNSEWLDKVTIQPTHEIRYSSPSGLEIHGWYLLPVGYEDGKQYPLIVNIHGGPHIMWGAGEASMFHEWQYQAANGYVVFSCNPRGADGYGEAFQKSIIRNWGQPAFEDVMAGVDVLIQKGLIDTKRMAVTGGSYGGYMTAWVISHTDRFACAASQRGVYNLISFYGTSDVPSLITGEFDVDPWEDPTFLWEHSPLAHAHKIKTPLLIIHAENDFRVPIEQGEQLFAFVRRSGGVTKLLRYPREGHEMSRSGEPEHRVHHLKEMMTWFDTYCKS
ncbi:MAG: S9 family peptidase [Phototrophicales bacterium]|nr:MAG: S9 family peptidase [Phototrophicales bacterium]